MKLKNLIITQESLRNESQICAMIDFIKGGGVFSEGVLKQFAIQESLGSVSPLIKLSLFEDGLEYIHDGHHRVISIYLGGRNELFDREYEISEWKYQDYLDVVFLHPSDEWMGWVTPHDVRTHVRLPDFKVYKEAVKALFYSQGKEAALEFVTSNQHQYIKRRDFSTVEELALALSPNCV